MLLTDDDIYVMIDVVDDDNEVHQPGTPWIDCVDLLSVGANLIHEPTQLVEDFYYLFKGVLKIKYTIYK